MAGKVSARTWGAIRPTKNGFQASYTNEGRRHFAPITFSTRALADKWLAKMRTEIENGTWVSPDYVSTVTVPDAGPTLREYAPKWVAERRVKGKPLRQGTKDDYDSLLRNHILLAFGDIPMTGITTADLRTWMTREGGGTVKAHAFILLSSILKTATIDDLIPANPCVKLPGAGRSETALEVKELSKEEVAALVRELPERYRAMALLEAWCSLRFGETAGLHREDIDLEGRTVAINRGVTWHKGIGLVEEEPKTKAGRRVVTLPRNVVEPLREHMAKYSEIGGAGLVFPARFGGLLGASSYQRVFDNAAMKIGRPDVTPHQLRHFGQTTAAALGANFRILMDRAGQNTPSAALRYINPTEAAQRKIADDLGDYAEGTG